MEAKQMAETARYRVNSRSYIGDMLVEEGGEVAYEGVPGSNLDPLNAAAEAAVKAARRARAGGSAAPTVVRTGQDLTSPFTPANPRGGEDEGHRGDEPEGKDGTANPQGRRGDPQPEVGPTETAVDGPAKTRRAARKSAQAAEKGAELREGTEEKPDADADLA